MQTSGVVFDLYDDVGGRVLRSLFPRQEGVPDFVKSAQKLSAEDLRRLPNSVFALTVFDPQGPVLRKYACVDAGNTALHVRYFLECGKHLPAEAQKVAAENLLTACSWYDVQGIDPEQASLQKIAGGLVSMLGRAAVKNPASLLVAPSVVKGTGGAIKQNLNAVRAGEADEGVIGGLHAVQKRKHAAREMRPIHLKGTESLPTVTEKKASLFALPSLKKYPLDSYSQVKTAAQYFTDNYKLLSPDHRREYAVNLLARADPLRISVSNEIRQYGSDKHASGDAFSAALNRRIELLPKEEDRSALRKLAFFRNSESLDSFCQALGDFDQKTGLTEQYDRYIPDVYLSACAIKEAAEDFSEIIGPDLISGDELRDLARNRLKWVIDHFGEDFAGDYRKDPIGIYQSLPKPERIILIHLAHSR